MIQDNMAAYRINPANFTKEFMAEFSESTMKIGERKMAEGQRQLKACPSKRPLNPRLATGGGFGGFFLWDTAFCTMWAKYAPERFPVLQSLDNFYLLQDSDGYICREYTYDGEACWGKMHPVSFNPPLLAWAEWELFLAKVSDLARLKQVYEPLKRHHLYAWRTFRRADGLFFGDALGGGMDYLPRMPIGKEYDLNAGIPFTRKCVEALGDEFFQHLKDDPEYRWNRQMGWIDITSQMAFNALNLARIAQAIGAIDDAQMYLVQHSELAALINELCFDEERGFYFDYYDGATIPRYSVAALWTLIAEVIPPERIPKVVAVLTDPQKFNRPIPIPALAACEPEYDPENSYWNGANWPCTTYMVLRGLRAVGEEELARAWARRYYNAIAELYRSTGTVWENISSEQHEKIKAMSGPDFVGWGGLGPITIAREFLQ